MTYLNKEPLHKDGRVYYLMTELDVSQTLVFKGIQELESIDGANIDYYPALLLLSNGLERLMKSVLLVIHWDDIQFDERGIISSEIMPFPYSGKSAHRLIPLMESIVEFCREHDHASKHGFAKEDFKFISNSRELLELIEIFSHFGEDSRYYNLNMVIKGKCNDVDPERVMSKLESDYIKKVDGGLNGYLKSDNPNKFFHELYDSIISFIARLCIALYRVLTQGNYSSISRRMSVQIQDFMKLSVKYDPIRDKFIKGILDGH